MKRLIPLVMLLFAPAAHACEYSFSAFNLPVFQQSFSVQSYLDFAPVLRRRIEFQPVVRESVEFQPILRQSLQSFAPSYGCYGSSLSYGGGYDSFSMPYALSSLGGLRQSFNYGGFSFPAYGGFSSGLSLDGFSFPSIRSRASFDLGSSFAFDSFGGFNRSFNRGFGFDGFSRSRSFSGFDGFGGTQLSIGAGRGLFGRRGGDINLRSGDFDLNIGARRGILGGRRGDVNIRTGAFDLNIGGGRRGGIRAVIRD